MKYVLYALITFYLACAVLDYGLMFAYWQRKYPLSAERDRGKDRRRALGTVWLGPFSLIHTLLKFNAGKYGIKF
jgi:hypothetical protein